MLITVRRSPAPVDETDSRSLPDILLEESLSDAKDQQVHSPLDDVDKSEDDKNVHENDSVQLSGSHIQTLPTSPDDLGSEKPAQPLVSFPLTLFGHGNQQQKRAFCAKWYQGRPWLEYSVEQDAAYCFACRKFGNPDSKCETTFVASGFRNWKVACMSTKGFEKHANCKEHMWNMSRWLERSRRQQGNKEVSTMVDSEQLKRNRYYFSAIMDIVLFLAANELPFRGDNDTAPDLNDAVQSTGCGLFLKLFDYTMQRDPKLREIYRTIPRNATYSSHDIQNDLISAMAETVTDAIVNEMGKSLFTLKVDGTRDASGRENLSLVVRYVTDDNQIKERLLCMPSADAFDAESLSLVILESLSAVGLDPLRIISQCYDGASVMSGCHNGVQQKLQQKLGQQIPYVHCYNHRLHLVVVGVVSASQELREFFDLCDCLYKFVKRPNVAVLYTGHALKRVLQQRWSGHLQSICSILESFSDITDLLQEMEVCSRAAADVRIEAAGLLQHIQSLQFIFIAKVMYKVLNTLKPADKLLQSREIDLLSAYRLINSTAEIIKDMRADNTFEEMWSYAVAAVPEVSVTKRKRKVCSR